MRVEIAVAAANGVGEGPFWDQAAGALLWVDIPGRRVFRWRPDQAEPESWPTPEFASAIVLARSGALVAMRDGVYRMDLERGTFEPFCRHEPDRPENRTNEAKCDPQGRFWVGTMQSNLHPDGSDKEMTGSTGALYCIRPDASCTREVDGVGLSNTLAWTPDGRTLLFGDTMTNVISAFAFDPESGGLGERRIFSNAALPGACDGSAIDADGFLWNARFGGGCVVRFAPDGRVDGILELPVTNPTSCCFGGADLGTLFVTSARQGMSPEQLGANPQEGALLAVQTGRRGMASVRFDG